MRLFSIIGEDSSQLLPVLYAYREKFKHHILLCDGSTRIRAENLAKGMSRFSDGYQLAWRVDIQTMEENSFYRAISQVKDLVGDSSEECWFNISDAYPMLTLLIGDFVREQGGQLVSYDHFTNTLHFMDDTQNITCETLKPGLTLHAYMTLLNYRIISQQKKSDLLSRKEAIFQLYAHPGRFRKLRLALLNDEEDFEYAFYRDLMGILEELGIIKDDKLILSQRKVISGDLFEEYIFWLCEALHPDDIAMGVKIDFDDRSREPLSQHRIHNEFDILLMHNNRIFTVECKYSKRLEGLEYVYKYDAIIDYFGKSSKAIIVNISNKPKEHYLGMKSSANFRHSTLRRARQSSIHIYHESQVNVAKFQSLVRSFFQLGGEDEDR